MALFPVTHNGNYLEPPHFPHFILPFVSL